MALTRKLLKSMGIEEEKIDQIIEAHSETVDALKEKASQNEEAAKKLVSVQKELDAMKEAAEKSGESPYKKQYEDTKAELDKLRSDIAAKDAHEKKAEAFRSLLKEIGVSEKRMGAVLKVSDIDGLKLDKDGKIDGADKLGESLKTEWSDFIETITGTQGAAAATPPMNTGGSKMSRADIYAKDEHGRYKLSASERQKALAENPELMKG